MTHFITSALVVRIRWIRFFLLMLVLPVTATANTSHVFGPDVSNGQQGVDLRLAYIPSDSGREDAWLTRAHYQLGFADGWRVRLLASGRRAGNRSFDYSFTRLEVQWQYLASVSGWNAALRFEAEKGDESPDRLRIAWTGSVDLSDTWRLNVNVLLGRQFGSQAASGLQVETRAKISCPVGRASRLALEVYNGLNTTAGFGSFDSQDHSAGILYTGRAGKSWSVNTGVLLGLSDRSRDATFRLFFNRNF